MTGAKINQYMALDYNTTQGPRGQRELQSLVRPANQCGTLRPDRVAKRKSRGHYRVFLSHSHKDGWIARQCVKLIEEAARGRIEVFLDERDIEVGQSIAESVRSGIKQCDEFVVLLSPYSKDRPWVLAETGAAWGLEKRIIVIIDKIGPKEMPDIVSPYKAVDLNNF
jgi:predicted nucleotide-binding protein